VLYDFSLLLSPFSSSLFFCSNLPSVFYFPSFPPTTRQVLDEGIDLTIQVTAFTGDPDLYVSRYPVTRPNVTTATWIRRSYGDDFVTIMYGTPHSGPGRYFIGVYGYSNTSYSVLATMHAYMPIVLVDGIPQTGFVNRSVSAMYAFYLPPFKNALVGTSHRFFSHRFSPPVFCLLFHLTPSLHSQVSLSPLSGDPDLYISLNGSRPSPTSHDYSSLHAAGNDLISISQGDTAVLNKCPRDDWCLVLLNVYGYRSAQFVIVATTNATSAATVLRDGVPVSGQVGWSLWAYYTFPVDVQMGTPQDVLITLTPLSGDADLYISTIYRRPNASHASWIRRMVGVKM